MKKEVMDIVPPLGIRLISIILYVLAAVFIFLGIATIFMGVILYQNKYIITEFSTLILAGNLDPNVTNNFGYNEVPFLLQYMGPVFIALGISLILIGLARIFIGFHLWNGKIWTKVLIISFSLVWISFGFEGIANGIIWPNVIAILFNLSVMSYVLFSPRARNFFRHLD